MTIPLSDPRVQHVASFSLGKPGQAANYPFASIMIGFQGNEPSESELEDLASALLGSSAASSLLGPDLEVLGNEIVLETTKKYSV